MPIVETNHRYALVNNLPLRRFSRMLEMLALHIFFSISKLSLSQYFKGKEGEKEL